MQIRTDGRLKRVSKDSKGLPKKCPIKRVSAKGKGEKKEGIIYINVSTYLECVIYLLRITLISIEYQM